MIKKTVYLFVYIILLFSISYGYEEIALNYNIIPDIPNNSVIDINAQDKLDFKLFQDQGDVIYCNGTSVHIDHLRFSIDISNLSGKQVFRFSNDKNETKELTYYISNNTELVPGYTLEGAAGTKVFVKTLNNVKILYTEKDSMKIPYVLELLDKMPDETKLNLNEITLFPICHDSGAAGITDYNKVKLYKLSSYNNSEIERIIFHEIAHTWAHNLRKGKTIDYTYTNFNKAIKEDDNFVSAYSKNSPSEDFADSVALYFSSSSFSKKHPARAQYISSLLSDTALARI